MGTSLDSQKFPEAPIIKDASAEWDGLWRFYCSVGAENPMHLSETEANFRDKSNPDEQLPLLVGDEDYFCLLSSIKKRRTEGENQCFIITTTGDTTAPWCPLTLSDDAIYQTFDLLGDRTTMAEMFQSRFPHISSDVLYNAEDKPEALLIGFRCPRNWNFLIGGLRIDLQTLNTTAMLSFPSEAEIKSFHQRLSESKHFLGTHPLYLVVLIFGERYAGWSQWFTTQWKKVAGEIETATGMTSKRLLSTRPPPSGPINTKVLLEQVHDVHAELTHIETVMKFAKRFGDVAIGAVQQVEDARLELKLPVLKRGDRLQLVGRMKCFVSRCDAQHERLIEQKDRLNMQINVVFGLIAQEDNKNSALVAERQMFISERAAEDSRVMRVIGLLTALFLPATFVTTLWGTSLVNLEPLINWVVWIVTSVALTTLVAGLLWLYDRQTAGKLGGRHRTKESPVETGVASLYRGDVDFSIACGRRRGKGKTGLLRFVGGKQEGSEAGCTE